MLASRPVCNQFLEPKVLQSAAPATDTTEPAPQDPAQDPSAQDTAAENQPAGDGHADNADASANADASNASDQQTADANAENGSDNSGPTYGGPPMLGVASRSKAKTIREFNKKDHYDQWQFLYDPTTDKGGLRVAPTQPALENAAPPKK
jgi:hypothetical protein